MEANDTDPSKETLSEDAQTIRDVDFLKKIPVRPEMHLVAEAFLEEMPKNVDLYINIRGDGRYKIEGTELRGMSRTSVAPYFDGTKIEIEDFQGFITDLYDCFGFYKKYLKTNQLDGFIRYVFLDASSSDLKALKRLIYKKMMELKGTATTPKEFTGRTPTGLAQTTTVTLNDGSRAEEGTSAMHIKIEKDEKNFGLPICYFSIIKDETPNGENPFAILYAIQTKIAGIHMKQAEHAEAYVKGLIERYINYIREEIDQGRSDIEYGTPEQRAEWTFTNISISTINGILEEMGEEPLPERTEVKLENLGNKLTAAAQFRLNRKAAANMFKGLNLKAPSAHFMTLLISLMNFHSMGVKEVFIPIDLPLRVHPRKPEEDIRIKKQKEKLLESLREVVADLQVESSTEPGLEGMIRITLPEKFDFKLERRDVLLCAPYPTKPSEIQSSQET